jgi:TolA-binding protein
MAETLLELEEKSSYEDQTWFVGSRIGVVSLFAAAVLALSACTSCEKLPTPPATSESPSSAPATERVVGPLTPADAQALATMNDRLKQYLDVRSKIERSLPKLPKEATPQQIDKNQRAIEKLVREARATAKPGDIFTPEARPVIKLLLASVFGGPDGKELKASIMNENQAAPSAVKLAVNGRYPDAVPLATVPPQVLQTLPKLTEDLEYRFIGDSLILLDVRAHVIADFIEDIVPK